MSRQLAWFILGFALIAAVAMQSVAHGWELETEVTKNHYAQDEKWNVLDAYNF